MHNIRESIQEQIRQFVMVQDNVIVATCKRLILDDQMSIWERHGHAVLPKLIFLLQSNAPIDKIVEDISSQMKLIESSYQQLIKALPAVASEEINAIFARLVSADIMLYWQDQSPQFQSCLKEMLHDKKPADDIFDKLMQQSQKESAIVIKLANAAGVRGVQRFHSSIGRDQLNGESVQALTNLIQVTSTIEIFPAISITNRMSQPVLQAAVKSLSENQALQHIMFPVGPGHWYWVTISKTGKEIPYSVEVFDPYCSDGESIYKFLSPLLKSFGIDKYTKSPFVNNGHIIPQPDCYSCGYYVAAYAHLKVKALDPNARCNDSMIKALSEHGNHNNYLRDICLHVMNPTDCIEPGAPQAKSGAPQAKSGAPQAKSGAPQAKSGAPQAKSGAPQAKSGAPQAEPRAPQAEPRAPQAKSQSFQLFSSKPLNSSNDWNLRGVKQAIHVILIAEAIAIAVFFAITTGPIAIPLLLLMICAVAAASIYMSNTIEPLTYTSR
ncbi:MAG: hypothetical protein EBY16_01860 [Gammaproteobacteria bacterium]|nr:hypothetical protein [Gammaproteobacteria bacterium]